MQTKLELLMRKKKMTKQNLAYKLDVSLYSVEQWLKDKTSPRLIHALKLKDIFGKSCKLEDLLKSSDAVRLNDSRK